MNSRNSFINVVLILVVFSYFIYANETSHWARLGFRLEQNFYLQKGLELTLKNTGLWDNHLQFKLGYSTSRLNGGNQLKKDHWVVSTAWYFLDNAWINPYLQCGFGRSHYDIEDSIFNFLDNNAWLLNTNLGVQLTLNRVIGIDIDIGYSWIQSSTVVPLTLSFGIWYAI